MVLVAKISDKEHFKDSGNLVFAISVIILASSEEFHKE